MSVSNRSVVGVVVLAAVLMSSCTSSADDSPEPMAVKVAFTDEATAREMVAFFEGYNAGSFAGRVETETLTLDSDQRRMDVTFKSPEEADGFIVMAEQADVVEVVEVARRSER